jgi:2-haloacid dehalogenase
LRKTPIKALFFDVFGTLVDFRSGVGREAERLIAPKGKSLDWGAFADAWRGEYQAGMEEIRAGREGYVRLDVIHRRNLDRILPRFGLKHLDEDTRVELNLAWHRLDAWPEVPAALARLRNKFRIAPLSNGNIALQVDLARRNDFPWDAILGGDFSRDYKPKPQVYLDAVDAFGLTPPECLMVACHSTDLAAAASHRLRTAHIARPDEHGTGRGETAPSVTVDFAASNLADLAAKLLD